jgi:hypothetical protein
VENDPVEGGWLLGIFSAEVETQRSSSALPPPALHDPPAPADARSELRGTE